MNQTLPEIDKTEQPVDSNNRGFACKVILFNDDYHTFDQVAQQCMKAINCTYTRGKEIANEVHATGSCIVYSGPKERCEAVAEVLEDIYLKTKVEE